ncbi:hypothetical protein [Micromonospora sp. DT233]|uniref:hypothetical protein n=1 Tax=Micromonospora sp. DT233 TaxID=3393432 RepID=UPI003CED5D2C
MIVTIAAVTFAGGRPPSDDALPLSGAASQAPAEPVPMTIAGQTPQSGMTATPRATQTASPSASPTPSTPSTPRPPSKPPASRQAPEPSRGAGAAPHTTAPPAKFVPLRIEAEAPATLLTGNAAPVSCGTCSGGARVRFIDFTSSVVFVANLPTAGLRTVRVTYETGELRQIKVKANGALVVTRWLEGSNWEAPRSFTFTTTLPAGPLRLTIYNDQNPSPDVDQVVIS